MEFVVGDAEKYYFIHEIVLRTRSLDLLVGDALEIRNPQYSSRIAGAIVADLHAAEEDTILMGKYLRDNVGVGVGDIVHVEGIEPPDAEKVIIEVPRGTRVDDVRPQLVGALIHSGNKIDIGSGAKTVQVKETTPSGIVKVTNSTIFPLPPSDHDVPIVAFFGTSGGVGKSTISNKFARIATFSKTKDGIKRKALIIDFDVFSRLTTITHAGAGMLSIPTMHDYIAKRSGEIGELFEIPNEGGGHFYMIPSASKDDPVFNLMAEINPNELLIIIRNLIKDAIEKYDLSLVVIDCGANIDRYTAAAAHIATHGFVIGRNDNVFYENLESYPIKIKQQYSEFKQDKMGKILNMCIGDYPEGMSFDSVIPDVKLRLPDPETVTRPTMIKILNIILDGYIKDLLSKKFEKFGLTPDGPGPTDSKCRCIVENAEKLLTSRKMRRLHKIRWFKPIGAVLFIVSISAKLVNFSFAKTSGKDIIVDILTSNYLIMSSLALVLLGYILTIYYNENKKYLTSIIEKRYNALHPMLETRNGQKVIKRLYRWCKKGYMVGKGNGV